MPRWSEPARIGSLELKHRILMGSMHMNLETVGDGSDLAAFYTERVRGGADLIVTGGIAVNRVGAGGRGYAVLTEPDDAARLELIAREVHAAGGKIALQLFHAGRYAFESAFGLTPLAPSAVYSGFSRCEPEAMTEEQIRQTIDDFAAGARIAVDAGFDCLEIMASEGYLLNQFASPVTNLRDDEWGGDAVRRARFPVEVVRAVRAAVDVPIIARTSGDDLMKGSSSAAEHDALAARLAGAGADAVNVGIGWHESRIPTVQGLVPHGMWIDAAARIRGAVRAAGFDVPVIGSNRINSVAQAEEVLSSGRVDLVSMARPFLADAAIVDKSRAGRPEFVNTCIGCNEACIDRSIGDAAVSCLVNPRAGRELRFPLPSSPAPRAPESKPAESKPARAFAVVGAGPAGMQAALTLAQAGHAVDLFDAEPRIGGQFRLACRVPGKEDFGETIRYFESELPRLGVRIHVSRRVSAADLTGYEHVIVAAGVEPRAVELPGAELPHVLNYHEAFDSLGSVGRRVAVIGAGGIAVDLSELLARPDAAGIDDARARERFARAHGLAGGGTPEPSAREVTIMRRSGRIGAGIGPSTRWAVVASIRGAGVRTLTDVAYRRITDEGVWIADTEPARGAASDTARGAPATRPGERLIPADTVVIAAGQEPSTTLARELTAAGTPYTVIGGARDASGLNAVRAFDDALQAAAALA